MKMKSIFVCLVLVPVTLVAGPLGTSFTYQGRLNSSAPANGSVPVGFSLWDSATGGNNVGTPTQLSRNATVVNWVFTVDLDFGATAFGGDARWLEIWVNGVLQPNRARIAPTPNAIFASTAGTVKDNGITAPQIAGAQVVKSLNIKGNLLRDGVTLAEGANITLTPSGNTVTIASSGSGGSSPWTAAGGGIIHYNGGNVGIGTANPLSMLQVSLPNPGGVGVFVGDRSPFGRAHFETDTSLPANTSHAWFAEAGERVFSVELGGRGYFKGNVGIGTGTPLAKLHVSGGLQIGASPVAEENIHLTAEAQGVNSGLRIWSGNYGEGTFLATFQPNGNVGIGTSNPLYKLDVAGKGHFSSGISTPGDVELLGGDVEAALPIFRIYGKARLDFPNPTARFIVQKNGNVGIGTASPASKLQVVAQGGGGGVGVFVGDRAPFGQAMVETDVTIPGTHAWFAENGSRVFSVEAGGQGYFGGNVSVCTLTIRGGCDLAEPFPMKEEEIEKGSVVVIDEEHPGWLKRSTQAYDKRVAGIVSGANGINPGIALKQEGALDHGENVALTGRVYVQADAAFGAIEPGDLLTTSDTPGHAMKVSDSARAQGAILGKAMTHLQHGRGMVLVLVTLQ